MSDLRSRLIVLCLLGSSAAIAAPDTAELSGQSTLDRTRYALEPDSIFAQGCMGGGWPYGCMCPLQVSLLFEGTFELFPDHHTPPGHHAYDMDIDDWLVVFGDEDIEISGSGYYDRWTFQDGHHWQRMTLDLNLYDEVVHFDSGVVADPNGESPPENITISLDNGADCFGYVFFIDAERLPEVSLQPADDGTTVEQAQPSSSPDAVGSGLE